jgi:hypothetical protein
MPAIATEKAMVFVLKEERRRAKDAVANGGLLPMLSQEMIFMG